MNLERRYCQTKNRRRQVVVGDRYGAVTVLADVIGFTQRRVLIKCDCGKVKEITLNGARKNKGKCSCNRRKLNVIAGERYGRLTTLKEVDNPGSRRVVLCRCDCGNEKVIKLYSLTEGQTKSCGCLHKEKVSKARFSDLTGEIFGKLTVIKQAKKAPNNILTRWECKCSCGSTTIVYANSLIQGTTSSCGCNRHSGGPHKKWTASEEDLLVELLNFKKSKIEIAYELGRNLPAVHHRIWHLGKHRKLKKCFAKDCKKHFFAKIATAKYCSDQCRWRNSKQKNTRIRIKKGCCPQCGDVMDKSSASYCTKCQEYFRIRNKK